MRKFLPRYLFWKLLIISILYTGCHGNQSLDPDIEKQVDEILQSYLDKTKPGVAVAVTNEDKVIFSKGYGSANLEYGVPITPNTIFHVASISKQFTVFAILLLEDQGRISFDDDIRNYIPEIPDYGSVITLRHLATHTSGLRDQWDLLRMSGWRWDDVITMDHIITLITLQKELNFLPGEQFNYCNSGFTLLAEVVSRVSGESFASFTRKNIFKPLRMNSTLFYDDHEKIVPGRAYSYQLDDTGNFKKSVLNYANVGATSLFTTTIDLSKWARNFDHPVVGNKNIISTLNTLHKLNNGRAFGGAPGQFYHEVGNLYCYYHGGRDAGFRTHLLRYPREKVSVTVLSNYGGFNAAETARRVASVFLPVAKSPKKVPEKSNSKALSELTGLYYNQADKNFVQLLEEDNTLVFLKGGFARSRLVRTGPQRFEGEFAGTQISLNFKETQKNTEMHLLYAGAMPLVNYFSSEAKIYQKFLKQEVDSLEQYIGSYNSEELQNHYSIDLGQEGLIINHLRLGDHHLTPMKKNLFTSRSPFETVLFQRGQKNEITGFRVFTDRSKGIFFTKSE